MRSKRKADHIRHVLENPLTQADYSDICILHNCLPKTKVDTINLASKLAGFTMAAPFFFNALTGGVAEAADINRGLARLAKHFNVPMAVGSQKAALDNPKLAYTYKVVRDVYPQGIIFANISANSSVADATAAVEMIQADALQIHLNAPQEAMMSEGDRDFSDFKENIGRICKTLNVPVIVKETGFGMAGEQAGILSKLGARALDVGGRGGTNFIEIEAARKGIRPGELRNMGMATPVSLIETLEAVGVDVDVVASGGVNSSHSIVASLCLGACAVGLAALPLKLLIQEGYDGGIEALEALLLEVKTHMALLGAKGVADLENVPLILQGDLYLWLTLRGCKPEKYARRNFNKLS